MLTIFLPQPVDAEQLADQAAERRPPQRFTPRDTDARPTGLAPSSKGRLTEERSKLNQAFADCGPAPCRSEQEVAPSIPCREPPHHLRVLTQGFASHAWADV